MIYREMPATWDPTFRPRFYARWGRESAIISAPARVVEYADYKQLLSIKAAFGGEEEYFVDGRRIAVDDDTFLILNAGRTYSSRVRSMKPLHSFSIFFRDGLVEGVRRALSEPLSSLLENLTESRKPAIEFAEYLHPHDRSVSPVLRHIYTHVNSGLADDLWIEEQLHFLLQRMLKLHCGDLTREATISSVRRATRKELYRRLGLALTFMHSNFREPLGLEAIAFASRLSRFHFLRTFRAVFGMTPSTYLNRHRTKVAARLLATTSATHTAIAHSVGFGARTTLFRHLRAAGTHGRFGPVRAGVRTPIDVAEDSRPPWPPAAGVGTSTQVG